MKTAAIILSVVSVVWMAGAQTNEVIIPILTAGGQSYTNARITHVSPAYAVVACEGHIVQVALSNLPAAYQQQYDYDPTNAAQYLADKKQEQLASRARVQAQHAAYQRYVASLAGTNQPVRIISINGHSAFLKCTAETETGIRDIYLKNDLPESVRNFISQLNQMRSEAAVYEVRVEDYTRAARHANAVASANTIIYTGGNANDANNQGAQARLMMNNAEDMQLRLRKMNSDIADMESQSVDNTTILAYPTGQIYDQLEVWNCTGLPEK